MIHNNFSINILILFIIKRICHIKKMQLNRHYIPGPHMMQVMQLTEMSEHV